MCSNMKWKICLKTTDIKYLNPDSSFEVHLLEKNKDPILQ